MNAARVLLALALVVVVGQAVPATSASAGTLYAIAGGSPIGGFESVGTGLGEVWFRGWMIDPNTTASGYVSLSVDGRASKVDANKARPDIAGRYPAYGQRHGFDATLYAAPGAHRVCVDALNLIAPGGTTRLGCRTVTVSATPGGRLESAADVAESVRVVGWAIDPDTVASIRIQVYVDAHPVSVKASVSRADVASRFPHYGAAHGFSALLPAAPGPHRVCAYAVNVAGSGTTGRLGCLSVTVRDLTFRDEFTGTTLDATKWWMVETAVHGFRSGDECYVRSGVSVAGGLLKLTASKLDAPVDCGGYATPYQSGMISSKGRYAQTYGRFEMRAKLPAGIGFQPAFWMLPENRIRTSGDYYGEIDIVESWGNQPDVASPHLHYVETPGTAINGAYCWLPTSATAFHTYAVEWTSTKMTFSYDGRTCWSTTWRPREPYSPAGATAPAPFDQPFYLMVELAMGGTSTAANRADATTVFPSSMEIDYVRAWK